MIVKVLAFLLTLGVLIFVHECGHYRVARACGVKVLRFSIGFGRVIWRRQRSADSTEFVLSALPLGGYVRMLDEREGPVDAAELHLAFNRKPLWQRAAVVAAGPLANLALAVVLYSCVHWIGVNEPKAVLASPAAGSLAEQAGLVAGDWVQAWRDSDGQWVPVRSVNDLRWQVTKHAMATEPLVLSVQSALAGRPQGVRELRLALDSLGGGETDAAALKRIGIGAVYGEPLIDDVSVGGPAAQAGLRHGDRVLSVNGRVPADAQALREMIRASVQGGTAQPLDLRLERAGQAISLQVTPRVLQDGERTIGRIDAAIGAPPEMVTVRLGPLEGLRQGAQRTWEVSVLSLRMLGRMLIGQSSLRNLSGPLTIADYAGQSAQMGLAYYLGFLALVSVSLGVLNLLPLPMLDGGHLMYYLFEGLTGRPVSDAWLARLQRGGIAVLLLMMSVALFNDVARLLGQF